jgi:Mn2+/Fe2+ NRAMP family transporter
MTLSEAISHRFRKKGIFNIHYLLVFSIIFGCLAYQAGNMTGALTGIRLVAGIPRIVIVSVIYLTAFIFLWNGRINIISRFLGAWVVLMAFIFILLCVQIEYKLNDILLHLLIPRFPQASGLYIIALIGTTIVPYNLFLGSGISQNQRLSDTRFGLASAIFVGGLITLFVLLSGTLITHRFSFEEVVNILEIRMGVLAGMGFGIGLFAAGLTSSITAPLAAVITAKAILREKSGSDNQFQNYYRATWIVVLSAGTLFSLIDYNPDVLIVIAQAVNGLILPFVAYYLYLILHDVRLIPHKYRNHIGYNILMLAVIAITIFLGIFHFAGVILPLLYDKPFSWYQVIISGILTTVLIGRLGYASYTKNKYIGKNSE